jgi:hypothetical protein
MDIRILLHRDKASREIAFLGTLDGDNFELKELLVPNGVAGDLPFVVSLTGRKSELLEPIDARQVGGSKDVYRFKDQTEKGATLTAMLDVKAGAKVFGAMFDANGQIDASVSVKIPKTNTPATGAAVIISISGNLSIDGGFSPRPLCFEIRTSSLPVSFPTELPRLLLVLPKIGLPLPRIELPWDLVIPGPPYRLPALTLSLAPIPLHVSYRSAEVRVDDPAVDNKRSIVFQFRGVTLCGFGPTVELEEAVITALEEGKPVALKLSVTQPIKSDIKLPNNWRYDDGCVLIFGSQGELNELLAWLMPELDGLRLAGNVDWRVRVLYDAGGISELRVDARPKTGQTLEFPGFQVATLPGASLHLVFRALGDSQEFWAGINYPPEKSLDVYSSFAWNRGEDRELLKDESHTLPINLKLKQNTEFTLLPLAADKDGIKLFWKSVPPIELLDPDDELTRCEPTAGTATELVSGDITPTFDLKKLQNFKLPFLRGGDAGPFGQFLIITDVDGVPEVKTDDFSKFQLNIIVEIHVGTLVIMGTIAVEFAWRKVSFLIDHAQGLGLALKKKEGRSDRTSLYGFDWEIVPSGKDEKGRQIPDFRIETQNSNYRVRQLPGCQIKLRFTRATASGSAIEFAARNMVLSPGGISLDAKVTDSPAKLNAVNTEFRFTEGLFQIRDNRITTFTLAGAGSLPPALVGPSTADIYLQFAQEENGTLALRSAGASLKGKNLLKCEGTRFQFQVTALGLKFVDTANQYHLYFTLSGSAKFVLASGDDSQGPLGWLPNIELDLVECPLTDDTRVLRDHVRFLIEIPKKKEFTFLGCFPMELRALEFVPHDPVFPDARPAMRLTGQVKFAQGGGDAVTTKVDLHDLHIGKPDSGRLVPRLYLKGLAIQISAGSFELSGAVDFVDEGTDLGGGVTGEGFAGRGEVVINQLPKMVAGFAFLRVKRTHDGPVSRAWFIYVKVGKVSLEIPFVKIFIREVGLGFGYRFTLAMIKSLDEFDDPKRLLRALKDQAKSQADLERFDQWRVDLEEAGEPPRWTVALQALFSQTSAAKDTLDWNLEKEQKLPCLFLVDAVAAVRSDLTFLMVGRAWLWANYADYLADLADDGRSFRNRPLFTGFLLLSPAKKRLLANFSSCKDPAFGQQGKALSPLRDILNGSNYTATLLAEPTLVHYELGWPNQLRWEGKLGPLQVEYRGGMLVRVSSTEYVVGQSFLARGTLTFGAEVDLGDVGARLSATASVAYGARYIGVLSFEDTKGKSAFYGAAGIEINVTVSVDFWIEIDSVVGSITEHYDLSFDVNFTASVEVGILLDGLPGLRGTATLGLSVLGHDLQFGVKVGSNEAAVEQAKSLTEKFLNIGLEAGDVEPVPGTSSTTSKKSAQPSQLTDELVPTPASECDSVSIPRYDDKADAPGGRLQPALETPFSRPNYVVLTDPSDAVAGRPGSADDWTYFILLPAGENPDTGRREIGFLPPPPNRTVKVEEDFRLEWSRSVEADENGIAMIVQQLRPDGSFAPAQGPVAWRVDWDITIPGGFSKPGKDKEDSKVRQWLTLVFLTSKMANNNSLDTLEPLSDPDQLPDDIDHVEDRRVYDPAENAFEAAVRGAADQFDAAPFFRHSDNLYDQTLTEAFDPNTSIYTPEGYLLTPLEQEKVAFAGGAAAFAARRDRANRNAQAHQMRGMIVHNLASEFKELTRLNRAGMSIGETAPLSRSLGLVFRCKPDKFDKDNPNAIGKASARVIAWLGLGADLGTEAKLASIQQRNDPKATKPPPDAAERKVTLFNRFTTAFDRRPPRFTRVVSMAHSASVALAWDLVWDGPAAIEPTRRAEDPEHHLDHYRITRRCVDGGEPDRESRVKAPAVLHKQNGRLKRCRSRFQFIDSFAAATDSDLASLPAEGRRYAYIVTPIDLTGRSGRPLTVMVRRFASDPPPAIASAELVVTHVIDDSVPFDAPASARPAVRTPARVTFLWQTPPPARTGPDVPVASFRLLFRRDDVFPAGSYGLNTDAAGERARGLPTTNARPLRTDRVIEFPTGATNLNADDPISGTRWRALHLDPDVLLSLGQPSLVELGVLPEGSWRPESWRVYVQTRSDGGAVSALTPIPVTIRFRRRSPLNPRDSGPILRIKDQDEDRRFGSLEWLPCPVSLPVLPPRDTGGQSGFILVPMPTIEPGRLTPGTFVPHPERRRAVRIVWNRGPSSRWFDRTLNPQHYPDPHSERYPSDLHAGFELYEFDTDAHTSGELDLEPAEPMTPLNPNSNGPEANAFGQVNFPEWVARANLRKVQEVEVLAASDATVSPGDSSDPRRWEAWYPSTVRRLDLGRRNPHGSESPYSPWFSWRESYLDWPAPEWRAPEAPDGTNPSLLRFEKQPFNDQEVMVPRRAATIHPLLEWLVDRARQVNGQPPYTVVWAAPPAQQKGTLQDLMRDTDAQVDPYGWSLLQRVGLAGSFILRQPNTGDPLPPKTVLDQLKTALTAWESVKPNDPLRRCLFVEVLYQQSRAIRLDTDGTNPSDDDRLAVVQVSLRPTFEWAAQYLRSSPISFAPPGLDRTPAVRPTTGKLILTKPDGTSMTVILKGENDQQEYNIPPEVTTWERSITLPTNGQIYLLVRTAWRDISSPPAPSAKIVWNGKQEDGTTPFPDQPLTPLLPFQPTDLDATYFSANADVIGGWRLGNTKTAWKRLADYIQAALPGAVLPPLDPSDKKTVPDNGQLQKPEPSLILLWLKRFFDHGGVEESPNAMPIAAVSGGAVLAVTQARTGSGWWTATAYPKSVTPVPVVPDPLSGRLQYCHPIEDLYAHAYRYYVKPLGRYDKLWEGIACSRRLYGDGYEKARIIQASLKNLRSIPRPSPGGFDEVCERVRPVAPPTILFSGRLDPSGDPPFTASAAVSGAAAALSLRSPAPRPGNLWQVVVAKHPEQELIERNRTMARQLAFRQLAFTVVRRFQDTELQERVIEWLRKYRTSYYPDADKTQIVPPKITVLFAVVDGGKPVTLPLDGAKSTLSDIRDLINANEKLNTAMRAEVESTTVSDEKGNSKQAFVLAVTPKHGSAAPIELLTKAASPGSNLLVNRMLPIRLVPAVTVQDPGLPEPVDAYSSPADTEPVELDLPERLGRFGQGAQIVQWRSMPYYYEHTMLVVAQAADVTSPVVASNQRDFEYVSPEPLGFIDAVRNPVTVGPDSRMVRFRLATYWRCLRSSTGDTKAQTRWPNENPYLSPAGMADPTSPRLPASLPDPGVVYQIVLRSPGDVIQVLSEFRFDPGATQRSSDRTYGLYQVRNFPARFRTTTWQSEVSAVVPWGFDPSRPEDMYLDSRLTPNDTPSSQGSLCPITSRHAIAFTNSPPEALSFQTPSSATLIAISPLTPTELASARKLLLGSKRDPWLRASAARFCDQLEAAIGESDTRWREIRTEVSLGLEQLFELATDPTKVKIDTETNPEKPVIVWGESLSIMTRAAIEKHMLPVSPFPKTITAFTKAAPDTKGVIRVPITDPGWAPRPTYAELENAGLSHKVAYMEGRAKFDGLMLQGEAIAMRNACKREVDKLAVDGLYLASLNSGFEGSKLQLRCYRGSAMISKQIDLVPGAFIERS